MKRCSRYLFAALLLPISLLAQGTPNAQHYVSILEDPDKSNATKIQAITDLQKLGPKAAPAMPFLIKLVTDVSAQKDPNVGTLARSALWVFRDMGKLGIPGLRAALKSPKLRVQSAIFLGALGADAREAAPEMLQCVADEPIEFSGMLEDVDHIGPDPKDLVPVAIKILNAHTDGSPKAEQYGSAAKLAAVSLSKIGPAAKEAVPPLIAVVKMEGKRGSNTGAVRAAIEALGAIGPAASDALPDLRLFINKTYGGLNTAAEKSIEQIKAK